MKSYKLKNKTNVILVPQEGAKSVTVLVMFPVGSRYEPEKLSGVSHYVEHLMFKGTKKRPSTLILTREIDRLGAGYNAFTGKEYTGYYIKVGKESIVTAIDILSDMLQNSLFDEKEMEREKGVIVEEIKMYRDNPLMNIENIFEDLLFDGCPLGRDIAGTEKHVLGYKRDDVLKFRDKYYSPQNTYVVVSGAVDEDTEKYIEEYFDKNKNNKSNFKAYKPSVFGSEKKEDRIKIEKKQTDQVQLMLGFPGFGYDNKDEISSVVMNTILGGSMSSRLFIQIRERRGLAYMIKSGNDSFRDIGYQYVRVGLEAKNINKAITVIKNEIEKICTKGVTGRELRDAKTHIRGGLDLSMEDSSSQANWYAARALFYKNLETPEERLGKMDKVTGEDIRKVAQDLFKWDRVRVAVIGDVDRDRIKY